MGNLTYFLHGLVERVGDIVQVVNGADKSRNGEGTTLPPIGVFALFSEDKMTKDPWLFWRGGEVETPEAASQWYVDCLEPPNHPKP